VDASVPAGGGDRFVLDLLKDAPAPRLCALNKIDLLKKEKLLPRLAALGETGLFDAIVPVSALTGEGVDALLGELRRRLPEGEALFPGGVVTTSDERTRIAETIREKFLERTREEIPYGLGVLVDDVRKDSVRNLTVVKATIVVDRDSHKGIVLGAGGGMLKNAGMAARADLERTFGGRFFLELVVAARPGWREDPRFLADLTS